jgi:hypothetical protein
MFFAALSALGVLRSFVEWLESLPDKRANWVIALLALAVPTIGSLLLWLVRIVWRKLCPAAPVVSELLGLIPCGFEPSLKEKPQNAVTLPVGKTSVFVARLKSTRGGEVYSCDVRFVRSWLWRWLHFYQRWQPGYDTVPSAVIKPREFAIHGLDGTHDRAVLEGGGGLNVNLKPSRMWSASRIVHIEVRADVLARCRCQVSIRTQVENESGIVRGTVVCY